ncbi:MAG: nitrous oxide-stimulated promoter family protein [Smithella sp.]
MKKKRLRRELKTIRAMIMLYCRSQHEKKGTLCADCKTLLTYAAKRLDKCPYGEDKPVCDICSIHCYKPVMRKRVRDVMRYAGPRLLWHHPLLAIRHLLDRRKPAK